MNIFDKQFQKGSAFVVLLGATATAFFAVYSIIDPERRYVSLFLTLLGLVLTWRQYIVRNRIREQGGLELIGTDPHDEPHVR